MTTVSPYSIPLTGGGWRTRPGSGGVQGWVVGADPSPWESHQKPIGPPGAYCGTRRGHDAHRARGTQPCEPCVVGLRLYQRKFRAARKAER